MMKRAGGVLADGTKSGTILDQNDDDFRKDFSADLTSDSVVSGFGVGSKEVKTKPMVKQNAANRAACSYVVNNVELAKGPITFGS
jgi:hypothetical protein